jgi:hypothetical protein
VQETPRGFCRWRSRADYAEFARGEGVLNRQLSAEHFVWLVGSLCQLNRVPFEAALLVQRYPAPHDVRQLLEACKAFSSA